VIDAALARGWRVSSPLDPARRTGWVGLDVPDAERVQAELLARRIIVDHRPGGGLRIGPHFYTTDEEIDRLVTTLDATVH
jgi:kynureninase